MPKSAAMAETPQLPELWLQWHCPEGLRERVGRRPGWAGHPPPSSFISAAVPQHLLNFSDGRWDPLPLGVFPLAQRAPHPRMSSAPATNYSLDKCGLLASRKGLGGPG